MGLFRKRTRLDSFRRSIIKAILPDIKTPPLASPTEPLTAKELDHNNYKSPIDIFVDEKDNTKTTVQEISSPELSEDEEERYPEILLLPAEILRDIFSYLDSPDLQSLYHTHPRFRGIVIEHRSFLCRELAARDLRYFARYLKPSFFDLQRESRGRFLTEKDDGVKRRYPGTANVPGWYLTLLKLSQTTEALYQLMPASENDWETEYLRIQGLPPAQYNPRVWPRPGNPSFYFTHTIISFYQYNSLIRIPKDSLEEFRKRDVKPVCRCAQGYFRSTAHLGVLCAVYMACLKYKTDNDKEEDKKKVDLGGYLPELGGGLGNYIKGTRVSVKELFKMVVVVMHPANLLQVIKDPEGEKVMERMGIVLETLKEVLIKNEEERRKSGVERMYTKGLEMMEGFARYWEGVDEEGRDKIRYFDDWDLL